MLDQFTDKEKSRFLPALIIGLVLGFGANYTTHTVFKDNGNPLAAISGNIRYGTVMEDVKRCVINFDNTKLQSDPSLLSSKTLRTLPKDFQLDYLETIPSADKDDKIAIAAYDLQFNRLFHRAVTIPKGTQLNIIGETAAQYKCSFTIDGKSYTKHFDKELVAKAYTGDWYRVQIGDTTGFVQANLATEPKYL